MRARLTDRKSNYYVPNILAKESTSILKYSLHHSCIGEFPYVPSAILLVSVHHEHVQPELLSLVTWCKARYFAFASFFSKVSPW